VVVVRVCGGGGVSPFPRPALTRFNSPTQCLCHGKSACPTNRRVCCQTTCLACSCFFFIIPLVIIQILFSHAVPKIQFGAQVFVARSDTVLKHSLMMITPAALVTNLPSIYYGFVRVAALPDVSGGAFAAVTGVMIDKGGFPELVAVVAACSALAAIMSTADSTIIGANNLLTVEWVKNFLWRSASPRQLVWVAKGVTVVFSVRHAPFLLCLSG
jgi:Na+/proline symporter